MTPDLAAYEERLLARQAIATLIRDHAEFRSLAGIHHVLIASALAGLDDDATTFHEAAGESLPEHLRVVHHAERESWETLDRIFTQLLSRVGQRLDADVVRRTTRRLHDLLILERAILHSPLREHFHRELARLAHDEQPR